MLARIAVGLMILLLCAGCGRPAPALQSGDVVRPQIALAPKAPWPERARVAIGMLIEVHRQGRELAFLHDKDVPADQAVMRARITFLKDTAPLGEPIDVPFVPDC